MCEIFDINLTTCRGTKLYKRLGASKKDEDKWGADHTERKRVKCKRRFSFTTTPEVEKRIISSFQILKSILYRTCTSFMIMLIHHSYNGHELFKTVRRTQCMKKGLFILNQGLFIFHNNIFMNIFGLFHRSKGLFKIRKNLEVAFGNISKRCLILGIVFQVFARRLGWSNRPHVLYEAKVT